MMACVEWEKQEHRGMNRLGVKALLWCALPALTAGAQTDTTLTYHVEVSANASSGDYAPLWFTANRNGLSSSEPNSAYLRAGLAYRHSFNRGWRIAAGLDLAGAVEGPSAFAVQQAYADVSWRVLNLSIGSKERAPLGKNPLLSSGGMVEGNNARPVPQVRVEIADYYTVPGTKGWFAFKGHVAYGRFADDRWQRNFARGNHQAYLEDVLYHSKALMFKVGNKERFPLEAEVGMAMSAQFGGKRHSFSQKNGEWVEEVYEMPHGLKNYAKVFLAKTGGSDTPGGDQVNVEGNHLGSWNFALNYYWRDWKLRAYYEHFFDDHSQMFFEYGRWKDGHLGIEITLPRNRWVSTLLWEGLATKDQSGPILYDGDERFSNAAYSGTQISAKDDYYNNYFYHRHNDFWKKEAMAKLPTLVHCTAMLSCAEDLGMIPACVPEVMNDLQILSLEIQRMPKSPLDRFGDPAKYPYLSVCTISTHDMSTLRGWWREDKEQTQSFYNRVLRFEGAAPQEADGKICEEVLRMNLAAPSMLCLNSFQDWLSIDEKRRLPDIESERINIPSNPKHYWRYRMHIALEDLISDNELHYKMRALTAQSGRL